MKATKHTGRVALAMTCCAVMFSYAVYIGAISVLLPVIGAYYKFGSAVSGQLFPAQFAGFIIGVLVCGYLSDLFGRKAVLLVSTAVYAIGLALFGLSSTFALALLASALLGCGSGAMETVASALAADLFPERRAFILNGIQVAFGVGAACSPSIAHHMLHAGIDWRMFYYGLAAANIGLFIVLTVQSVPRSRDGSEALNFGNLGSIMKQPAFLMLCFAQLLYVGGEVSFFSWMPSYFRQRLPSGAAWEGLIGTVFWSTMTVGRFVSSVVVERLTVLRLIALLAGGGVLFSALALVWTAPMVVLCFIALTGLCFSGIFSSILAEAGERYPAVAGTVFGVVMALGGVGGALVPWAVGALAETSVDWRGAFLVVPVAMSGVAFIALYLKRVPVSE